MPTLQPARGTQDILPEMARRHRRVGDTARATAELYGFAEIATPIFEFTEVFARPIGEHTDIVAKEMYSSEGSRRRGVDPAAGKHRRGRARGALERPDPGGAAQILLQRPDVPLRAAAEGPVSPISSDRRRTARCAAAAGRYRGHRARPAHPQGIGGRRPGGARAQHPGRCGKPRGLSRGAGRLFLVAPRGAVGRQRPPPRHQPVAHPRFEGSRPMRASTPTHPPSSAI